MKRKYKIHPGEYEIGENEKFYGDMEAKGWRLVKRGTYFSRFEPAEPSRARYRIEVYSPPFLERSVLPDEQVAVFEDCGWEYVTDVGFLHIFRAPEGSGAPEFYVDPAQQAETLKKVRRGLWSSAAFTVLVSAAAAAFFVWRGGAGRSCAQLVKRFIQIPYALTLYALWILCGVYQLLWDAWKISRTYRRLKKGIPLDHAPKRSRRLRNPILLKAFWFLSLLCMLATGVQTFAARSQDLPPEPAGPYIMLSDIGYDGEPGELFYEEPGLICTRSFLADYWETVEIVSLPGGSQVWMRQYVYRLRFPGMADKLAWALMEDSTFTRGADRFRELEVPGLDRSWTAGDLEVVAIKGNMAAFVISMAWDNGTFDPQAICEALAEKWSYTERQINLPFSILRFHPLLLAAAR